MIAFQMRAVRRYDLWPTLFRRCSMVRPWYPLQFINRKDPFVEFKDFPILLDVMR